MNNLCARLTSQDPLSHYTIPKKFDPVINDLKINPLYNDPETAWSSIEHHAVKQTISHLPLDTPIYSNKVFLKFLRILCKII